MGDTPTIDYAALADQARQSSPAVDYAALAEQARGTATPRAPLPTLPTNRAARRNAMAQPNVTVAQRAQRENEIVGRLKEGFTAPEKVTNTASETDLANAQRFTVPGAKTTPLGQGIAEAAAASNAAVAAETMGQPELPGAIKGGVQLAKDATEAIGTKISEATDRFAAARQANKVRVANETLAKAIPSTKGAPYKPGAIEAARPHIEDQIATGGADVTHVQGLRDALNEASSRIEDHVDSLIAHNPNDTLGGKVDLDGAVKKALGGNVTKGFVDKGLKALDDSYDFSNDMKVADAKKLLRQLNDDMQAQMKKTNNYSRQNLRNTDPEFAAREALASELRNGIFGKLEDRGMPGVRQLRKDQGDIISLRNAAEAKINAGEGKVTGTQTAGAVRRGIGRVVKLGAIAKGAEMAGAPGAVAGAEVGEAAQQVIAPGNRTRNQLIKQAFKKPLTQGASSLFPDLPARPSISGQLPATTGVQPVITPQPGASVQTPAEVAAPSASAPGNPASVAAFLRERSAQLKPTGSMEIPKDFAAKLDKAGLVNKGELFKDAGVYQAELPDHPGKTFAVKITDTPEIMMQKAAKAIAEFTKGKQ